jgi:hypothetical protein
MPFYWKNTLLCEENLLIAIAQSSEGIPGQGSNWGLMYVSGRKQARYN